MRANINGTGILSLAALRSVIQVPLNAQVHFTIEM